MTWLPNNKPPHMVVSNTPEFWKSMQQLIDNHLETCEECRAWKEANPGVEWRRWITEVKL